MKKTLDLMFKDMNTNFGYLPTLLLAVIVIGILSLCMPILLAQQFNND